MIAEAERVESMQVDANILVIGIVSHKTETVLKDETSKRDQKRVTALQGEFKCFTMSDTCGNDINCDRVHHLNHKMNKRGAAALIKHLNEQNPTVKFDFICLEYVRMPGTYYRDFVTGKIAKKPGTPLLEFLRGLRAAKKLNSGCKLLLVSIGEDERWLKTKQLLEKDFGQVRDVEAKENPYYRACERAQKACVSVLYDHVEQTQKP